MQQVMVWQGALDFSRQGSNGWKRICQTIYRINKDTETRKYRVSSGTINLV